jgi:hypothetical protein
VQYNNVVLTEKSKQVAAVRVDRKAKDSRIDGLVKGMDRAAVTVSELQRQQIVAAATLNEPQGENTAVTAKFEEKTWQVVKLEKA